MTLSLAAEEVARLRGARHRGFEEIQRIRLKLA